MVVVPVLGVGVEAAGPLGSDACVSRVGGTDRAELALHLESNRVVVRDPLAEW